MKLLKGKVSIVRSCGQSEGSTIKVEVVDSLSGLQFLEIEMTPEEFGLVVTGASRSEVNMKIRGLENVGKKHERELGKAELSSDAYEKLIGNVMWSEQKVALANYLLANHQRPGWTIDTYLGSQTSVVRMGERVFLNFSYHRYVDQKETL